MLSVKRLVADNLPNAKPELWANVGGVIWRRLSTWANTKLDHGWPDRPMIATIRPGGLMLEVIPRDVIGAPIAQFGIFEFAVTQLLRAYLSPGDVFVDVGANIGYYSVIAGGIVGSAGRVIAFEPSARVRARLERNIALNAMAELVEVRPEAVSNEDGLVRLVEPMNVNNDGLAYIDVRGNSSGVEVPAIRLDAVNELTARPPALLKVDVEGGEPNVYRGAAGLLSQPEAPSILFESFEIARDAEMLRALGYQIYQPQLRDRKVRLVQDLTLPRYRHWEAPNYLAVKSARGQRFVAGLLLK